MLIFWCTIKKVLTRKVLRRKLLLENAKTPQANHITTISRALFPLSYACGDLQDHSKPYFECLDFFSLGLVRTF